jgi:hypothetical protein
MLSKFNNKLERTLNSQIFPIPLKMRFEIALTSFIKPQIFDRQIESAIFWQ